jgi:hypothetical protein
MFDFENAQTVCITEELCVVLPKFTIQVYF